MLWRTRAQVEEAIEASRPDVGQTCRQSIAHALLVGLPAAAGATLGATILGTLTALDQSPGRNVEDDHPDSLFKGELNLSNLFVVSVEMASRGGDAREHCRPQESK